MQDSNVQARQGFALWEEYPSRSPKTAMFVETDSGGEESQGASSPTWSAERDQVPSFLDHCTEIFITADRI